MRKIDSFLCLKRRKQGIMTSKFLLPFRYLNLSFLFEEKKNKRKIRIKGYGD